MNGFETIVMTGNDLQSEIKKVVGMKKRAVYSSIRDFMLNTGDHYVGVLYGLRRTGKTTLLRQLVGELCGLGYSDHTALLLLSSQVDMDAVLRDLQILKERGCRFVLVDEITEVKGFSDGCALLSDYFSGEDMRILLSGTNSLLFSLVTKHELYDRAKLFYTTFVPYAEYMRLHPSASLDDFLKRSGVASPPNMSPFATEKTALEYIDSAIAKNINYSLERYRGGEYFASLHELYANDLLVGVINKIVNRPDHSFLRRDFAQEFSSDSYGAAKSNLNRRNRGTGLKPLDLLLDSKSINESHAVFLGVDKLSGKELHVTETQLKALRHHLLELGVIKEFYHFVDGAADLPVPEIVFTQPGLRYSVANSAQHSVDAEIQLKRMDLSAWGNITKEIENNILGRILEDAILLESMAMAKYVWGDITERTPFVSRYNRIDGDTKKEVDTVILNPTDCSCTLIEVKHSEAYVPDRQCKWLTDKLIEDDIREHYNPASFKRLLVYAGDSRTCEELNIEYVNAGEFLSNLGSYIF